MPQIYKDMGIGEKFGTGLGQGLSQGLQQLADIKLTDYMKNQQLSKISKSLESLGYSPQEAQGLAQLDPKVQQAYIKQKLSAPQNQSYANIISSLIGGQTPDLSQASGLGQNQFKDIADFVLKKQQIDATKGEKERATTLKEEGRREKIALEKQKIINKQLQPKLKKIEAEGEISKSALKTISEIKDFVKNNKLSFGTVGYIKNKIPLLANADERSVKGLIEKLITQVSSLEGVNQRATNQLRDMIRSGKVSLDMPQKAFDFLLDSLEKDLVPKNILNSSREKLQSQYGFNLPENLEDLISKESKIEMHNRSKKPSEVDTSGLPDPKKYKGKGFLENSTGRKIIVSDGKWVYGD